MSQPTFLPPANAADNDVALDDELDTGRVARPKRAAPADAIRPTRAEVSLAAMRHNLRTLRHGLRC